MGQKRPGLEFLSYPDDKYLSVVTALDQYSLRTSEWRKVNKKTQLLAVHIEPLKEKVSSMISAWIINVGILTLTQCGQLQLQRTCFRREYRK